MTPELCAAERCRLLRERIHALNQAVSMDVEERLDALFSARKMLKRAEQDLANGK